MIQNLRKEKQAEFIKMKYDAAIAKYENEGEDSEMAKLIKEFNYSLDGIDDANSGDIQRRY